MNILVKLSRWMTAMAPERGLYSRYSGSKGSSYGGGSNHSRTYRQHQMPQLPQQVPQQAPQLFHSILPSNFPSPAAWLQYSAPASNGRFFPRKSRGKAPDKSNSVCHACQELEDTELAEWNDIYAVRSKIPQCMKIPRQADIFMRRKHSRGPSGHSSHSPSLRR